MLRISFSDRSFTRLCFLFNQHLIKTWLPRDLFYFSNSAKTTEQIFNIKYF